METNNRLAVLLKNPTETGRAIDSILQEIKEESTKIYDEVFKDFSGDYKKEYRELRSLADKCIEIKSKEIRNKYFDSLDRQEQENYESVQLLASDFTEEERDEFNEENNS